MKIAVVATVWFPLSHADVVVTRWVEPFVTDDQYGWSPPSSRIVSVYLEQRPDNDIGMEFCAAKGLPVFDSVAGALTMGGDELAVDAVLLIGEHGDYPRNEFGQKLYPRKRLFDEITAVFRSCGKSVPVFNDKHFSWDFAESTEMLATAAAMGFPLYGGSSLTHCPSEPASPIAAGEAIGDEAMALFHGDPDAYGYHSIEFLQSFLEKRAGGELGIAKARAWEGRAVKEAVAANEISPDLFRSLLLRHGYPDFDGLLDYVLTRAENPVAFQFEHVGGLKVTHLLLPKFVSEWVVGWRSADGGIQTARLLAGAGATAFFSNFAQLNARVDEFFRTGVPPTPPLRTHLTLGALQAALQALRLKGGWLSTPQLNVQYGA